MGFFSFKTCDTDESVSNTFSVRGTKTVYLLSVDGEHIKEPNYEGYGVFGGVDCFVWLVENNKPEGADIDALSFDEKRSLGISMHFEPDKYKVTHPIKLSFDKDVIYSEWDKSEDCELLGYFYDDDEEDDDDCYFDYDDDEDE